MSITISSDLEMSDNLSTASESENSKPNETTTNWRLIIITGIVSALISVENSVLGMGEWPYMSQIDSQATVDFFGVTQSAAKGVHAIFAVVFSVWSFKARTVKIPMLFGRFISLLGCILYLGVEFAPSGRRYVLLTVYIILGISNSASTVLRGYIVMCSAVQDRSKAFAFIGLSSIVSIVVGPIIQLIFSGISYPGFQVFPGIRFHIFSAPIWISFLFTIITIVIVMFFMHDVHPPVKAKNKNSVSFSELFSIETVKKTINDLRQSGLKWRLIAVCLFVKIAVTFANATMGSIMSIIFMVQYGWSGSSTVVISAVMMIGFGVISSGILVLYVVARLGEILPQERVLFGCLLAIGLMFVITYPFPFDSQPITPYNATTDDGCNPEKYTWCESAIALNPYFFMIAIVLVFAPTMPMMSTGLDTVYSKVLGNIDQNVAQGAMTVVEDIVSTATPILVTSLFTAFGVGPLWITKACIFIVSAAVWFLHMRQIRKQIS